MSAVIVGAGHAGVQAAESLRANGYHGAITLLDRASHLPYQRPPLSKDFLQASPGQPPIPLRGADFYNEQDIDLQVGDGVNAIDVEGSAVVLGSGKSIPYEHLILATGASPRRTSCDGSKLEGLSYLGTVGDAERLRARLHAGNGRVVIVGAGFIGLEFATVAVKHGFDVTVIDAADRPMQRVLTPSMSEYFREMHTALGVKLYFNEGLEHFLGKDGRVVAVGATSGSIYPCDFAVIGLGAIPGEELAASAGISCSRGVLVDEFLRTSHPGIYAIGDNAVFPSKHFGGPVRLESVQNATDMAKAVAKTICGSPTKYDSVPWFWSNQGSAKLQIAGLIHPEDQVVLRGDRALGKFSQFSFRDGRLVGVESVNAPADHVAARRILENNIPVTAQQVSDPNFDLKEYAKRAIGG